MLLDFWFDYSCPYAYAASALVQGVATRSGATLRYRPFLLGGVFRAVGTAQNLATTLSPQKALHLLHDQQRALVRAGLPLRFPPPHPRRTDHAQRATLAAARIGDARPLVHALFRAYWADGLVIEDEAVVRSLAARHLASPSPPSLRPPTLAPPPSLPPHCPPGGGLKRSQAAPSREG